MDANIVSHFASVRVGDLDLPNVVAVARGTAVCDVVAAMAAAGRSSAVVTDESGLVGIFTERDVTTKVAGAADRWDRPIEEFMTMDPVVVSPDDSAVAALRLLIDHNIRNLPVVADAGSFVGTLTIYDLIRVASAYLRTHDDSGHDLTAEASLEFIDLTGIEPREPLEIEPGGSVADAIALMVEAGTGLVLIVNDRGVVIGEFTEHDVFTKIACRVSDLDDEVVGDWLTQTIAGALPTTSIADSLHLMAEVGHRYLVLLNENDHALGVLTFRAIAEYFETALQLN